MMINTHIVYVLGKAEMNKQTSASFPLLRKCLASAQGSSECASPLSDQSKQGIWVLLREKVFFGGWGSTEGKG